ASVVRQGRGQYLNRAGRYRGSGREWSGSQARALSEQEKFSRGQNQAGSATRQEQGTGAGMQEQDTGPGKRQHQGRVCRSECPLNTPSIISSRCLTGCKVESLIAGSTRWPALVLQLTRQVSPTIAGQSIPDS
ncbi:unnamed protein product, partial [Staurois parvus]